ncbi:MAG: tetratricopeptide repeat protein [Bryobacteraceae bacterium]
MAAGAAVAINALSDDRSPDVIAHGLAEQPRSDTARIVSLYAEALRRDSASPYRWADLGDAFVANHQLPEARLCFQRALDLNRRLPQIWLRDANFHFMLGENDAAMASASRVLKTVPDYDGVLFNYFDQMIGDTGRVFAVIGQNRRAALSYVNHLVATGQVDFAISAWQQAFRSGIADKGLTTSYINLLIQARRYPAAKRDWSAFLGLREDDANSLFNGGFEDEPSGAALDWRIQPSDQFETTIDTSVAHDGKRSLHIHFLGTENVVYANTTQLVIVRPGSYQLRAWVHTREITTNEGPRLEIFDPQKPSSLDVRTGPLLGSWDWTLIDQPFTVPAGTDLISVRVLRTQSAKFDNKIAGDFWMDSVQLVRD